MKRNADNAMEENGPPQKRRVALDDQSLQEAVKVGQRASPEWKDAWRHWCDRQGHTVYDPVKHPSEFLKDFFRMMGNLYLKDQVEGNAFGNQMNPLSSTRNSQPQRSTQRFVTQSDGDRYTIRRDRSEPKRRPQQDGLRRPGPVSTTAMPQPQNNQCLQDLIKAGQRNNNSWKEAWGEFCAEYGNGINDPKKHAHNPAFFVAFCFRFGLSTVGREDWAQTYLPGIAKTAMPLIVDAIKQGQRSSPEWKEKWSEFCTENDSKFMDPTRHDAASLLQFIDTVALAHFEHEEWMAPFVSGGPGTRR